MSMQPRFTASFSLVTAAMVMMTACGPVPDGQTTPELDMVQQAINKEALKAAKEAAKARAIEEAKHTARMKSLVRSWQRLPPGTPGTGIAPNGLRYRIDRAPIPLLAPSAGGQTTEPLPGGEVFCRTAPTMRTGAFGDFLNADDSLDQSMFFPGAVFRDAELAAGIVSRKEPPRVTGPLFLQVTNQGNPISVNVANFNHPDLVQQGHNTLMLTAGGAPAATQLRYASFDVASSVAFALDFGLAMDAGVESLLGLPPLTPSGSASASVSVAFAQEENLAVAVLEQVFYTLSVGASPAATFSGAAAPDEVMVASVKYGRRAFISVGSRTTRARARSALNSIVSSQGRIAQARAELNTDAEAAFTEGQVRVAIVGGDLQQAVRVDSLDTLRDYIERIPDPTIAGVNAAPLSYSLVYASDNTLARVAALADFTDQECIRAAQVKVTLQDMTATKVVDAWFDEEIYGTVQVENVGATLTGTNMLFEEVYANPYKLPEGKPQAFGDSGTFTLDPTLATSEIEIRISLRDRIMKDGEDLGAGNRTSVGYGEHIERIALSDLRANNGTLPASSEVHEGEAKIVLNFLAQLLPGPF